MNLALLLFGPRKMHFFFLFRVLNEFENILVLKDNKIVTLFRSFGGFIAKIVTFRKLIGVHKTNCVHIKTQLFTRMTTHLQNVHISLWTDRRQRFTGMEHDSMEWSHTRRSLQPKKVQMTTGWSRGSTGIDVAHDSSIKTARTKGNSASAFCPFCASRELLGSEG